MFLTMYDLSGIQDFIFQTNRLKEAIGASYLVSKALMSNVPGMLNEESSAWKTRTIDQYRAIEGTDSGCVVYIGGGNALVLFGSKEAEKKASDALKRLLFEQTGGALRLCAATVEVKEGARLAECQRECRLELDRIKAITPAPLTMRGFSLDELDSETREPVLFIPNAAALRDGKSEEQRTDPRFMTKSRFCKLAEYAVENGKKTSKELGLSEESPFKSPLVSMFEGYVFREEFKDFFKAAAEEKLPRKHYLALIHIDGNTMGKRIAEFTQNLPDQSFFDDLIAMRDLSRCISESYAEALVSMVDKVYGKKDGALPFRPIVADGDDITFICRSEKAFECVSSFVEALNSPESSIVEKIKSSVQLPQPQDFSVGAGIVFCPESYPFSTAYDLAEQLCSISKKTALARSKNEKIPAGVGMNTVDFHICAGEATTSIKQYRSRHYCGADAARLNRRPFHIPTQGELPESADAFSFAVFNKQLALVLGSDSVARSKLKGMRDKYEEGVSVAKGYGKEIVAREIKLEESKSKKASESEAYNQLIKVLENPYIKVGGETDTGGELWARLFDELDVMDLCLAVDESSLSNEEGSAE